MRKVDVIRERLVRALSPTHLQILDESAHHAGHSGARPEGETHFRVEITAEKFKGISLIARHRLVYAALDGAFSEGLHALEIHTHAPE